MVKLEEVSPDHIDEIEVLSEDDNYSDYSDSDIDDDEEESILDRIAALKDIIPQKQRDRLSSGFTTLSSWSKTGATFVGKSAWVITTSMLLLVLPLALEIEKEQALVAYEKEALQQQGAAQQMINPGAPFGQPQAQQGQPLQPQGKN
ncbi:mitochondrial outer membrane translocase complex, subunit Tom22 [Umbelopsis sp. PMI_123]|nr:mitochondrial outer membrane translocase complex, subunit Tom22 [Umbelopsis sp. PMI_123]